MAARYWVGGAGTWDGTSTTHWAATSGGTSGASAPTATDNVVFDANSGLGTGLVTVVIASTAVCGGCVISGIVNKCVQFQLSGNVTWSAGTYTFAGSMTEPILISSSTTGTTRTLTINGTHSAHAEVHFRDITIAGTGGQLSGTRIGDCGGISGINANASDTKSWVGTTGGSWDDITKWDHNRLPLPQDDCIITTAFAAAQTITFNQPRLGRTIDFSGCIGSPGLAVDGTLPTGYDVYGSLDLLGTSGNLSSSLSWGLRGRTPALTWRSAGNKFRVTIVAPGGSYVMQSDHQNGGSGGNQAFSITFGGLYMNGHTITCFNVSLAANAGVFLDATDSAFVLIGTGTVWTVPTSVATISMAGSTITLTDTSATAKTFVGGNKAYGAVVYKVAGSGGLAITGDNSFELIDVEVGSVARTLTLPAGGTQTASDIIVRGLSGAVLLSIVSSTPGTGTTLVGCASSATWLSPSADVTYSFPYMTGSPSAAVGPSVGAAETVSSPGSWAHVAITSKTYQWQRDTLGNGIYTDIPGETDSTYYVQPADYLSNIRVVEFANTATCTHVRGDASAARMVSLITYAPPLYEVLFGFDTRTDAAFRVGSLVAPNANAAGYDVIGGLFSSVFAGADDDVSNMATKLSIKRGQAQTGGIQAGSIDVELHDPDAMFDPENLTSPVVGKVDIMLPCRVRVSLDLGGTYEPLGYGWLRTGDFDYDVGAQSAKFTFEDVFVWLDRYDEPGPVIADTGPIRADEAIGLLFDAIGWPSHRRNFETGSVLGNFWGDGGKGATALLTEILEVDGGAVYQDRNGDVVYRNNYSLAASTPVVTLDDGQSQRPGLAADNIKNIAKVKRELKQVEGVDQTEADPVEQVVQNDASVFKYGPASGGSISSTFIRDDVHARQIGQRIVRDGGDSRYRFWQYNLIASDTATSTALLEADYGDKVTIGSRNYSVVSLEHAIEGGALLSTTYTLVEQPDVAAPFTVGVSLVAPTVAAAGYDVVVQG